MRFYHILGLYGIIPTIISLLIPGYFFVFFSLVLFWFIRGKIDATNHRLAVLLFLIFSSPVIFRTRLIDIAIICISLATYFLIQWLKELKGIAISSLLTRDRYFKHLFVPIIASVVYSSPFIFFAFVGNMMGIAVGDLWFIDETFQLTPSTSTV